MGLLIAGGVALAFIALAVLANASCPAVFTGNGGRVWLGTLALAAVLMVAAGIMTLRGASWAIVVGRASAGLASGLLVQPSSAIVFAGAVAVAALASRRGPLVHRVAGALLLGIFGVVGYTFAFSPIVLGDPVRC